MSSPRHRRAAALFVVASLVTAVAVRTAAQTESTATTSIWDGVFTAEQAQRGQAAYTGPCDRCHGYKLDGASNDPDMLPAPPVAGPKFLRRWNGRSLATLLQYTRATMPSNNPGHLSEAEVADIVAYMLLVSGVPAGKDVLLTEAAAVARISIVAKPQ
jgi:quinoprotein glucose dehydrogenase